MFNFKAFCIFLIIISFSSNIFIYYQTKKSWVAVGYNLGVLDTKIKIMENLEETTKQIGRTKKNVEYGIDHCNIFEKYNKYMVFIIKTQELYLVDLKDNGFIFCYL